MWAINLFADLPTQNYKVCNNSPLTNSKSLTLDPTYI